MPESVTKSVRLITVLLLAVLQLSCSDPPPADEVVINQHLASMLQAAQNKEADKILQFLHEEFRGNATYRKANIRGMLFLHFRNHQHVHVLMRVVQIDVTGEEAKVLTQLIVAGRNEDLIPERGRVLEITSRWVKQDDEWRVREANWKDPFYPS